MKNSEDKKLNRIRRLDRSNMRNRLVSSESGTKRYFATNLLNGVFATVLALLLAYSVVTIFEISWKQVEDLRFGSLKTEIKVNDGGRSKSEVKGQGHDICEIKVVLILCDEGESKAGAATAFERQMNQTLVLIKSVLIKLESESESSCIQISIISNKKQNFEKLKTQIFENPDTWDVKFTPHLELVFVPLRYPSGTSWMRSLFRPCATLRLFLPDILPYDSVLYLDTDIIFFRSIHDLWSELRSFKVNDLAAMAPCLVHYGTFRNLVPYYGSSGLNAGIMLMNLTRMRLVQWTQKMNQISIKFKSQIKLADQDVLNIYFEENPDQLHLLSCEWNFRHFQCHAGSACHTVHSTGVAAIHGNALSFTPNGPEPLFYSIFTTIQQFQLNLTFDLHKFSGSLEKSLDEVKSSSSACANFPEFKTLVLKQLLERRNKIS